MNPGAFSYIEFTDFTVRVVRGAGPGTPLKIDEILELATPDYAGGLDALRHEIEAGEGRIVCAIRPSLTELHVATAAEASAHSGVAGVDAFLRASAKGPADDRWLAALDAGAGVVPQASRWVLAACSASELQRWQGILAGLQLKPRSLVAGAFTTAGALVGNVTGPTLVLEIGDSKSHGLVVDRNGVAEAVPLTLNRDKIAEVVQTILGLKFRGSAGKLFFNPEYDFSDVAAQIAAPVAEQLKSELASLSQGRAAVALYCPTLPTAQQWFVAQLAGALGLTVHAPDVKAWSTKAGVMLPSSLLAGGIAPTWLPILHAFQAQAVAADGAPAWQPEWRAFNRSSAASTPAPAAPAPIPAVILDPPPATIPPTSPAAPKPAVTIPPVPVIKPAATIPPAPASAKPATIPPTAEASKPATVPPAPASTKPATIPPAAPAAKSATVPPAPAKAAPAPAAVTPRPAPAPAVAAKSAPPPPSAKGNASQGKKGQPAPTPKAPVPAAAAKAGTSSVSYPPKPEPQIASASTTVIGDAVSRTRPAGGKKLPLVLIGVAALLVVGAVGFWMLQSQKEGAARLAAEKMRSEQRLKEEQERARLAEKKVAEEAAARQRTEQDLAQKLAAAESARQQAEEEARRQAAARAANARGTVVVTTDPRGASVVVGALPARQSPATFTDVRTGRYPVRITLEHYDPVSFEVEIRENETTTPAKVVLSRLVGTLEISSTPAGATFEMTPANAMMVDLNARKSGRTPATLENVAPGDYVVTLTREGWAPHKETVTVARNATARVAWAVATGNVRLTSEPAGAKVRRAGRELGVTPLTLTDQPPGAVEYEFVREDYDRPATAKGQIEAGKSLELVGRFLDDDRLYAARELTTKPAPGSNKPPSVPYYMTLEKPRIDLELTVYRDGTLRNFQVLQSSHKDLARYCTDAMSKWKYRPATIAGKPVSTRITVSLTQFAAAE